ncbi:hypothetical protein Curi_c13160 [Gottschalkia acidurici 9a]|uniref:DUF4870 domain-containing protein n=1 Tax=Gottschalkia acidurici (strain ATCC 7906 / DSM 604 / BCRC 14475 / CIP 104303 / KCTC 5404 / NCIMB 10678 / 9a) TaxID=1128398 RepID=K0AZW2_GOTA9|nr:DUF4870 domain-containing protein [Gottschalkia acidurici]AFS78327.1 hypothetical protein Curi_c13160 [Gottschalkia acidurici 9a]
MLTTEQKLICTLCHLSLFISLPVIVPLIVLVVSNSQFVKQQAKEALAFQIGLIIMGIVGGVLTLLIVGIFILIAVGIAGIVLPIVAVVKISDNIDYSYPISGKFVRG